ncbi:hypothetical protein VTJ49DRAFT_3262 [Mycothermus thermophilus]|uniref:FYVE-type domain-containing protein n=1 Tax=Humicola insolens TaxID=85995 RepID=A0ABR3V951_HUMIN
MATDFIMPRAPGEHQSPFYANAQQPQPQHQYRPRQPALIQPSPIPAPYPTASQLSSPVSPFTTPGSSISPTAPKTYSTPYNKPLYVPAVLRPTEFPSKEPPPRPKDEDEDDAASVHSRPSSGFMSLGPFGRLSRRSTADTAKSLASSWDLDEFPTPTGPPTRAHWKVCFTARTPRTPLPDHESTMCDHAACKRTFSYFTRRHHCRKCGNIFCDQHSALEVPLDQGANFNPRGVPSRACDHCYAQFKEWRKFKLGRASSVQNGSLSSQSHHQQQQQHANTDTPSSPVSTGLAPVVTGPDGRALPSSEVAHSVPSDWTWSTF